jgi:hypothetical protein
MSEIILSESPEAAKLETVTGWVSRRGFFYGKDERLARYDGSTHRPCSECGELIEKNGYCRPCHAKKEIAKFEAMPRKKWDGVGMLYSDAEDRYFYGMDDVDDYCDSEEVKPEALRLIICEPTYAGEVDAAEFYENDLPEEGDVPRELQEAFDELNEFIRESKIILSWHPGKFALDLSE